MELLVMLLVPFPLGFLVPGRGTAYLAYVAVHAFVFPFQTLVLLLDWVNGAEAAFGPYPAASCGQVWGDGAVNLLIYLAGLGLVALGQRAGAARLEGPRARPRAPRAAAARVARRPGSGRRDGGRHRGMAGPTGNPVAPGRRKYRGRLPVSLDGSAPSRA